MACTFPRHDCGAPFAAFITQLRNNGDTTMMKFLECSLLKTRSAVEQDADTDVPTFLCAEYCVLKWEDRHSRAGKDKVGLFPAWVEGKRAFMIRRDWCAGHGYTADGIHDTLITFEEGVKLLVLTSMGFTISQRRH